MKELGDLQQEAVSKLRFRGFDEQCPGLQLWADESDWHDWRHSWQSHGRLAEMHALASSSQSGRLAAARPQQLSNASRFPRDASDVPNSIVATQHSHAGCAVHTISWLDHRKRAQSMHDARCAGPADTRSV